MQQMGIQWRTILSSTESGTTAQETPDVTKAAENTLIVANS
jgi:hypothetical protein